MVSFMKFQSENQIEQTQKENQMIMLMVINIQRKMETHKYMPWFIVWKLSYGDKTCDQTSIQEMASMDKKKNVSHNFYQKFTMYLSQCNYHSVH